MSNLAISLIGLSVMSLFVELLSYRGETAKYVKAVYAIIVVLVLTNGILGLLRVSVQTAYEDYGEVAVDTTTLSELHEVRTEYLENYGENVLRRNNFTDIEIAIEHDVSEGFGITKISLLETHSDTRLSDVQRAEIVTLLCRAYGVGEEVICFE